MRLVLLLWQHYDRLVFKTESLQVSCMDEHITSVSTKTKAAHQVAWSSREPSSQLLPLRSNSHRAVVGVTDSSHDAARGNHSHSAKAKLVPSQGC